MDNFDEFKQLWQQPVLAPTPIASQQVKHSTVIHQRKLERAQFVGTGTLLLSAIFLLVIGFGIGLQFQSVLTYAAIGLLAAICAGQAIINFSIYRRLRHIDVTAAVTDHLKQWEAYYAFRKRLIHINGPVYFLLLNGAFGLYFIEILGLLPLTIRIIALSLYVAWMLFAYFVLGKRILRKEEQQIIEIINNLRQQQQQLTD